MVKDKGSVVFLPEQEQERKFKVNDLKVITGGGGFEEVNWLGKLMPGTHFLFRPKNKSNASDVGVSRAVVCHHYKEATLLCDNLTGQEHYFIVMTSGFSNVFKLIQVIGVEGEDNQEQEETGTADVPSEGQSE